MSIIHYIKTRNTKTFLNIFLSTFVLFSFISCSQKKSSSTDFTFRQDNQGITLLEQGKPVYFYQIAPVKVENKELKRGQAFFNHYFHPLYDLDGQILTEAHPPEDPWHPHQRGVFWAWHQIYMDTMSMGDSWVMDDIKYNIKRADTLIENGQAILNMTVTWITTRLNPEKALVEENDSVIVYPLQDGKRIIDYVITLKALVPGIKIAGSRDTIKGYGGFSVRLRLADSMLFVSEKGAVTPVTEQLHAGPWVDISTPLLPSPQSYFVTIMCHPSLPNFPPPWLLRKENSMQNPAFPGWDLFPVSMENPTVLRYRLIIHQQKAQVEEINEWFRDYSADK